MELYEISPLPSVRLKARSPLMYWLRIILLSYVVVHLSLVLVDDVEASTVSTFNVTDYTVMPSWNLDGAHTKDDFTVVSYGDSDGDLMLAYRRPEESWSHVEIADRNYLSSTTDWTTCGAVVTSNNSVVVYALFSPSGTQTSCLFISYGDQEFTDPWNYFEVDTGSDAVAYEMAINDTDHIGLLSRTGSVLLAGVYDFNTDTMKHSMTNWYSSSNPFGSIIANKTGVFHIAYGPGMSTNYGYVQDYYKLETPIKFTNGYQRYNVELGCLENDRLVVAWAYTFGTGWAWFISIQSTHEGSFWQRMLRSGVWTSSDGAISVKQNSSIFAVAFHDYTSGYFYKYEAAWDADQSTWQASQTLIFTDLTHNLPTGGFNQIWPRFNNTSFSQPTTGWVFIVHEDDPAPQDILYLLYDNLNWTGDMVYEEPEPEPEPDGNETTLSSLWWGETSCIVSVLIILVIVVVALSVTRE